MASWCVGIVSSYQRVCASRLWHWHIQATKASWRPSRIWGHGYGFPVINWSKEEGSSVTSANQSDKGPSTSRCVRHLCPKVHGKRYPVISRDPWRMVVIDTSTIVNIQDGQVLTEYEPRLLSAPNLYWSTCSSHLASRWSTKRTMAHHFNPTSSRVLRSTKPQNHAVMAQGKCWSWKFHAKIEQSG